MLWKNVRPLFDECSWNVDCLPLSLDDHLQWNFLRLRKKIVHIQSHGVFEAVRGRPQRLDTERGVYQLRAFTAQLCDTGQRFQLDRIPLQHYSFVECILLGAAFFYRGEVPSPKHFVDTPSLNGLSMRFNYATTTAVPGLCIETVTYSSHIISV